MGEAQPGATVTAGDTGAESLAPGCGEAFGKYALIAKIGHGGMAEVFLAALHGPAGFTKLGVLKRLHSHLEQEPTLVAMFLDEARLAARLNHPNVVQTYEVGQVDGRHFLTMEHLEGQPLGRVLRRLWREGTTVPVAVGVRFFIDVLDGLHYAHTLCDYDGTPLRVVHRDVSPSNLFVTYEGQAKVLDFGIAKAATHLAETRSGQLKGKFAYVAPERTSPQPRADHRADLWSLGVTMWETFAGRPLFEGESEMVTLHNALHAPIPPLASVADVPAGLGGVVDRALRRDPSERYATAREMKEDLERVAQEAGVRASRKELGVFVADLFESERAQQRRVLEAWMRGERSTEPLTGASLGVTTPHSVSRIQASQPTPRDDRRKAAWLLGGVTLLLGGILGAVGVLVASQPWRHGRADHDASVGVGHPRPRVGTQAAMSALDSVARVREAVGDPAPPPQDVHAAVVSEAEGDIEVGEAGLPSREVNAAVVREGELEEARRVSVAQRRRGAPARVREPRAVAATPELHPSEQSPAHQEPTPAEGLLTLDTHPWSRVSLGERSLGTTPIVAQPLPAGTHLLTLYNPERGIRTTYRVTIRPGETTVRRVALP